MNGHETHDRGSGSPGPLAGIRLVEFASLAPAPFACMLLGDLGARILRIDRPGRTPAQRAAARTDPMLRGRTTIELDVKAPSGAALARQLLGHADVLVEGFRPGVMERLDLGPDACLAANPGLVYGRMTGWGQTGRLAPTAGHDINYLSIAGGLHPMGRADETPPPPLNLVADFGGGGMVLAFGIVTALLERATSGLGQVIDAAMTDGTAQLATSLHGMLAAGMWTEDRGTNILDGGAPFYDTYRTADDRFISVGALEPQFYAAFLAGLGLGGEPLPAQDHRRGWSELRSRFAETIASRTRDEWTATFEGTDACVTPVLTPTEAAAHGHNRDREAFVEVGSVTTPAPAPRLSRTPARVAGPNDLASDPAHLEAWGIAAADLAEPLDQGVLELPPATAVR